MIVKIENRYLTQVIDLLFDLSLVGKQSRHRTRFIKLLQEQFKKVEEERKLLAEEFSNKDKDGNPIIKDGYYDISDMETFKKEYEILMNEEFVIEGEKHQEMLKTVKEVLLNCDVAFSGHEAMIYDYLCEQFEKGDEE